MFNVAKANCFYCRWQLANSADGCAVSDGSKIWNANTGWSEKV